MAVDFHAMKKYCEKVSSLLHHNSYKYILKTDRLLPDPQPTNTQWEFFFLSIPNILGFWADRLNQLRGILGYTICSNFVTVYPYFWFCITKPFFLQENITFTYTLQDCLFGIGIWFWAVDDLGYSHHVSVVGDQTNESILSPSLP